MLDSLMGTHRDISRKDKTGDEFAGENICKHHLVGFCPDGLMGKLVEKERNPVEANNKMPLPCQKTHSIAMKAEFEAHPRSSEYKEKYEASLLRRLEDVVSDVDKMVQIMKRRCQAQGSYTRTMDQKLKDLLKSFETDKELYTKMVSEKGEAGDVSGAQLASEKLQETNTKIEVFLEERKVYFPGEECCTLCAMKYLQGRKSDVVVGQRDYTGYEYEHGHTENKYHIGYREIRDQLTKLREKRKTEQLDRKKHSSRSRSGRTCKADGDGRPSRRGNRPDRSRDRSGGRSENGGRHSRVRSSSADRSGRRRDGDVSQNSHQRGGRRGNCDFDKGRDRGSVRGDSRVRDDGGNRNRERQRDDGGSGRDRNRNRRD